MRAAPLLALGLCLSLAAGRADIGATAKYVMLQVQGAAVYCTYDGTTPSATNGIYVNVFEKTVVQRALALRMKFIRVTAADGYVMAQPFNSLAA